MIRCRKGVDHLMFEYFGEVGWASNSGFHALNLAIQFGAGFIILVGFDCSIDKGLHWHGRHQGLNNPRQSAVDKWRRILDAQKPILDRLGIPVVIGSPGSRLENYPRLNFMGAVNAGLKNFDERRASGSDRRCPFGPSDR